MSSILVINDDPVQLHLLVSLLEQDHHEVSRYQSAKQALDFLQGINTIEAVVVDLQMPEMDGWQFCRLVRSSEDPRVQAIPILIVSATYSGVDMEHMTVDVGANSFLPLPVEPARLRECVRELVNGKLKPATLQVLLVDGEVCRRDELPRALLAKGWHVRIATTAQEALDLIQEQVPDIAIVDQQLPDMRGLNLLTRIKPENPWTVEILITSDPVQPFGVEALRSGAHACVQKPFDSGYVIMVCEMARRELAFLRIEALLEKRTINLRDSENRFQTLFEGLPDIIVVYDQKKIIRHINTNGAQQLGWSPPEVLGRSLSTIRLTRDAGGIGLFASPASGVPAEWTETMLLKRDGLNLMVEMTERAVMYGDEHATMMVARDISDRKRMEEEKFDLERQLRQAQKMEAVGRLAAGVAHDVNNILTAILGHASLLKARAGFHDSMWRSSEVIEQAVHRGQQLSAQLLGFARQGKYHHVPVNLHEIIKEVATLFSRRVGKSITFKMELGAETPWIEGDPNQLHQVVMNLAVNACDAMADEGRLVITTANQMIDETEACRIPGLNPGPSLVVGVTDTGAGIPSDVQSQIFEPFFTTKEKGRGSGMGLAMVYGIVKNHHGYISVASEVGRGTTMKIYFPSTGNPDGTRKLFAASSPVPGYGRILVVDDQKDVAGVAAELLEYLGYQVAIAYSGDEAMGYYRHHKDQVDLVILDMIMEGMSGADCFFALQKENPNIKVVLCTGYDRNNGVQELLNQGVAAFVQKPYDLTELSQVVEEVLTGPISPNHPVYSSPHSSIDREPFGMVVETL